MAPDGGVCATLWSSLQPNGTASPSPLPYSGSAVGNGCGLPRLLPSGCLGSLPFGCWRGETGRRSGAALRRAQARVGSNPTASTRRIVDSDEWRPYVRPTECRCAARFAALRRSRVTGRRPALLSSSIRWRESMTRLPSGARHFPPPAPVSNVPNTRRRSAAKRGSLRTGSNSGAAVIIHRNASYAATARSKAANAALKSPSAT
jgi:hypothetical protein